MTTISIIKGSRVMLLDTYIDEVRNLAGEYDNILWTWLSRDPLGLKTHYFFARAVKEQSSEDRAAMDRFCELYDQYVEFFTDMTGTDPSKEPFDIYERAPWWVKSEVAREKQLES